MKLYIEEVLILNFLMDLFILKTVCIFIRPKRNCLIIISAIVSSLLTLLCPIFYFNTIIFNIYKFILGIILVIIPFKINKKIIVNLLLTFLVSNIYAGMLYSLQLKLNSIEIIILSLFVLFILKIVMNEVKKRTLKLGYYVNSEIVFNNKRLNLRTYIDSANFAKDENNLPLTLISLNEFLNLTDLTLIDYLNSNFKKIKVKRVCVCTVTGKKMLISFLATNLIIHINNDIREIKNATIAVTNKFNSDYELLISPELLNST